MRVARTMRSDQSCPPQPKSARAVLSRVACFVALMFLAMDAPLPAQQPTVVGVDAVTLRSYAGVYQWTDGGLIDLQLWPELTGTDQLVAFDESGELRALYATGPD